MMRQAISRNATVLTTFALGFALILGVTEWFTREPIATVSSWTSFAPSGSAAPVLLRPSETTTILTDASGSTV